MKLMIFESGYGGYDGYDDKQLLVIDNIDILPNKGDEIVVHDRHYIVESFLWHTDDENVCVTMFVNAPQS